MQRLPSIVSQVTVERRIQSNKMGDMTKDQIYAVLDRVHSWPKARQEDAARLLLAMGIAGS